MLHSTQIKHEGHTITPLTLDQAKKEESSSLWVLNRTKPSGKMLISVIGKSGDKNTVTIPNSFAPIDVTMFETKDNLLESPQFRRQVSMMSLALLSEKDARTLMQLPHVEAEYKRLYPELADSQGRVFDNSSNMTAEHALDELADTVSPMILNLLDGYESYTEEHALSTLRSRAGDFGSEDFKYLANRAPWASVKTWASEALAERSAA